MFRKLFLIYKDLSKQMSKQNISAFAASSAFFVFLSLIPMLIMICTIIPFTPLTEENLLTAFTEYTPNVFNPLIRGVISQVYEKSAGILSLAALVTVWSAGKGVLALIRGLNSVNGVVEERNYFLLRLTASFYTVLVLVMTILSLLLMVFGNVILAYIVRKIPQTALVFQMIGHFRFLVVWLILTVLLTLIYAFAAVLWSVFSWGFSVYVDFYNGVNAYGSLSIIMLLMLWLYECIYIVMVGAYLNRYFSPAYHVMYKRRKKKAREKRQAAMISRTETEEKPYT